MFRRPRKSTRQQSLARMSSLGPAALSAKVSVCNDASSWKAHGSRTTHGSTLRSLAGTRLSAAGSAWRTLPFSETTVGDRLSKRVFQVADGRLSQSRSRTSSSSMEHPSCRTRASAARSSPLRLSCRQAFLRVDTCRNSLYADVFSSFKGRERFLPVFLDQPYIVMHARKQ